MYGDYGNVTKDSKTLYYINCRQGSELLLDIVAESVGRANLKFKFSDKELDRISNKLLDHLKEAILERV